MKLNWPQLLKSLLIPTGLQAGVSLGLAVLIELIAFRTSLSTLLASGVGLPTEGLGAGVRSLFEAVASLPYADNSAIVIFWVALGTLVYLATLAIHNSLIDARNNVIIQTEFTDHPSLQQTVTHQLLQGAFGLLTIGALLVSGLFFIPLWSGLCGGVFDPGADWASGLWLVVGILGLAINIYIVWMLVLLTLNINKGMVSDE
jgi:hypothetical protein